MASTSISYVANGMVTETLSKPGLHKPGSLIVIESWGLEQILWDPECRFGYKYGLTRLSAALLQTGALKLISNSLAISLM